MAGWTAAATIGIPIAADLIFGGDAKSYSPWDQADAHFKANPDLFNYFGQTTYETDDHGNPKKTKDFTRKVTNTMSPQMQALADRMMGMAGRGQQTFTSGGMGSLLQDRVNSTVGESTQPNYNRSSYGFNQGAGPVQEPMQNEAPQGNYSPDAYRDLMEALRGGSGGGDTANQRY
jgi:hypothetical protein